MKEDSYVPVIEGVLKWQKIICNIVNKTWSIIRNLELGKKCLSRQKILLSVRERVMATYKI